MSAGELLVGNGPGATTAVRGYAGLSDTDPLALADDPRRVYGVFVG